MRYLTKYAFYNDLKFQVFENVYEPAEDTFLVADNLSVNTGDTVLDVGTGCGILATIVAQNAAKVVAIDINPHAIRCTKKNLETNCATGKVDVRMGDLFKPVRSDEKFTLIIFNAPYLPSNPEDCRSWLGKSWAGGPSGRRLIDRFIVEAPKHLKAKGRILLVQSNIANVDETIEKFLALGLNAKVIAEKKVAFDTIALIQASHLFEQRSE